MFLFAVITELVEQSADNIKNHAELIMTPLLDHGRGTIEDDQVVGGGGHDRESHDHGEEPCQT